MQMRNALQIHGGWMNGVMIIFGYLWLVSGIDKIGSGQFVPGFHDFVLNDYIGEATYSWYADFLKTVVLPHPVLFSELIQWGEFLLGVVMIGSAVWLMYRGGKMVHLLLALANLGGAFLVLNIMLAEGTLLTVIDTSIVYEEGVSIDMIVFLISLLIAVAHFKAWREEG